MRDKRALVTVPTPKPSPGTAFPARRLTVRGIPVFELNLWCGTCPALFKKLAAPQSKDLGRANERLSLGLTKVDEHVVRAYADVLPKSTYTGLLLEVSPGLVQPGGDSDYFSHEQVTTWGIDPVVGSPEDPGTPYYRTFETRLDADAHLYEFVVPMVPPTWNDRARVAELADSVHLGTAMAYSLLDVLEPASGDPEDHYQHWTLTHFLLDGHHKFEAAAASGMPVRLLALIDQSASIASGDDVAATVTARSQSRRART